MRKCTINISERFEHEHWTFHAVAVSANHTHTHTRTHSRRVSDAIRQESAYTTISHSIREHDERACVKEKLRPKLQLNAAAATELYQSNSIVQRAPHTVHRAAH